MIPKPVLLFKNKGERLIPDYRHPDRIVKCRSKEELEGLLKWYSYPFIKHRLPDDPHARRRYVEQVRPALRWFCKKFGVNIPSWLEGNAHYEDVPDFEEQFGKGPFQVREFEEWKGPTPKEGEDADAQ